MTWRLALNTYMYVSQYKFSQQKLSLLNLFKFKANINSKGTVFYVGWYKVDGHWSILWYMRSFICFLDDLWVKFV